eukprot:Platyproteum_vivax@DN10411_c0_g1_i1.p1
MGPTYNLRRAGAIAARSIYCRNCTFEMVNNDLFTKLCQKYDKGLMIDGTVPVWDDPYHNEPIGLNGVWSSLASQPRGLRNEINKDHPKPANLKMKIYANAGNLECPNCGCKANWSNKPNRCLVSETAPKIT